jgi:amphi-Trp domain-containing protein
MPEIDEPEQDEPDVETIDEGYFEDETYVDLEAAGAFLVDLGQQLREGGEVTLEGDGWRIPFTPGSPVELDIEFEGSSEPELEVEVEMTGQVETDEVPDVA